MRNAEEAFDTARQQQKPILLIFSGSDWCIPCIRFEKKVLHDTAFIRFAQRELIILNADFPQRKKLSSAIAEQNETLAKQYNPNGIFPFLLLLKPDKSVLTSVDYRNQSPQEFLKEIRHHLSSAHMLKEYSREARLMGSAFGFIVLAENERQGESWLDDALREVQRIEDLLTEFRAESQTSLINASAGLQALSVPAEIYQLIGRSKNISRLTDGAFDISAGPLRKLYNFKGADFVLPDKKAIAAALQKTGYQKIRLTAPSSVLLEKKGMHIGFGAIGKGYASDKVKILLEQKGVISGVVNASGDLTAWGRRASGEPWKTGIAHPDHYEDPSRIIAWLPLNGMSVATSGNYIQYFEVNGVRYSHNIDPRTGLPVSGIKSVTVVSPSAELSDALATAVTVMGVGTGLDMIGQLPQTHCILVDDHNQLFHSKQIDIQHAV